MRAFMYQIWQNGPDDWRWVILTAALVVVHVSTSSSRGRHAAERDLNRYLNSQN